MEIIYEYSQNQGICSKNKNHHDTKSQEIRYSECQSETCQNFKDNENYKNANIYDNDTKSNSEDFENYDVKLTKYEKKSILKKYTNYKNETHNGCEDLVTIMFKNNEKKHVSFRNKPIIFEYK